MAFAVGPWATCPALITIAPLITSSLGSIVSFPSFSMVNKSDEMFFEYSLLDSGAIVEGRFRGP